MLKKIGIVVLILIAGVLGLATTKPDTFRVERSATINAAPEAIFPHVNDFHNWVAWSPWEKLDPALKRTYSGPVSGTGAAYGWEGNSDVGVGRMEIVESTPPSKIVIQLDFLKPMEGHNTAEFNLQGSNAGTLVTWSMQGPNPFFAKVFQVFCNMDRMVGGQFEQGLANLKVLVEK